MTEQGKVSLPTANDSLFVYFRSKANFQHIDKVLENEGLDIGVHQMIVVENETKRKSHHPGKNVLPARRKTL